jgi:hypothetical protein
MNEHKILEEQPEEKESLQRLGRKRKDNIKWTFKV